MNRSNTALTEDYKESRSRLVQATPIGCIVGSTYPDARITCQQVRHHHEQYEQ
jgi:hypothetical protein